MQSSKKRNMVSAKKLALWSIENGMTLDACLKDTGLTINSFTRPELLIDSSQELSLFRNMARHFGEDSDVGLAIGMQYGLDTYGVLGFALLGSENFHEAAKLGLRFLPLTFSFCEMSLEIIEGEAHFVVVDNNVPEELKSFVVDRDCGGVLRMQRDVLQAEISFKNVKLRRSKPKNFDRYIDAFGCTPLFEQCENRAVFDSKYLQMPLPGYSPGISKDLENDCIIKSEIRQHELTMIEKIQNYFYSTPGHIPTIEQISLELSLSPRNVRRALELEGTTYMEVVTKYRKNLAAEYLKRKNIRLEEISDLLGYSHASNFSHAFKRWFGITVIEYQRCFAHDDK
ncbi:AraC family transcriptional regulator [Pseudomonas brenneri]